MRFVVSRLEDFPPDTRRIVRVGGREIGVFRTAERFYAVRNRCPHQGGPLCAGNVRRRLLSREPGRVELADGTPLLVCPWHGWQYDLATGESFAPGDLNARSYPVSVEPGDELVQGEYVVETFPVRVEEEYIVLDA
jgi:nitrite reductase/ring-hydroxylating ferredoxin subunit